MANTFELSTSEILNVASFLNLNELANLCLVSKLTNQILQSPWLYGNLYSKKWVFSTFHGRITKAVYKRRALMEQGMEGGRSGF